MTTESRYIYIVTQPDVTSGVVEVVANPPPPGSGYLTIISTIAHPQMGSVPVGLPEQRPPSGIASEGFLFRLVPGAKRVSVRLDTRRLLERERVRQLNESLRRSTQG